MLLHAWIVLIVGVLAGNMADATRYHQANLDKILSADPLGVSVPVGAEPPVGNISYLVSLFHPPAFPADFLTLPIRIAPICVAYNDGLRTRLELSMHTIGTLLTTANDTVLDATVLSAPGVARVSALDMMIVLARSAPVNYALLQTLIGEGINGFSGNIIPGSSVDAFPEAVRTNPRVKIVPTNADVVATVRQQTNVIGFFATTLAATWPEIVCAPMVVETALGAIAIPPTLEVSSSELIGVEVDGELSFAARAVGASVFPLLGLLFVSLNSTMLCQGNNEGLDFVTHFVSSADTSSKVNLRMLMYGMVPLEPAQSGIVLQQADRLRCSSTNGGASTIQRVIGSTDDATIDAVSRLEATYRELASQFIDFRFDHVVTPGSWSVGRALQSGVLMSSSTKFATPDRPSVYFIPYAASYISILVNIPSMTVSIVIPRCTLLRIFTGDVQYWDDPELVAANFLNALPHEKILVIALPQANGINGAVTRGLAAMLPICRQRFPAATVNNSHLVVESLMWPLPYALEAADTGALLDTFQATPFSIACAAGPDLGGVQFAKPVSMLQASLWDEASDVQVQPSLDLVSVMMSRASVNGTAAIGSLSSTTSSLVIPIAAYDAYPFLQTAYWVYDGARPGNCSELRAALTFALWTLESALIPGLLRERGFVATPRSLAGGLVALVRKARCGGALVFPADATADVIVASSVGVFALLAAVVVGIAVWRCCCHSMERDLTNAPKSSPFAILFTDVESSTALWAHVPGAMGAALDVHNEVIRAQIAKHGAYEVKTIGDAFMIAIGTAEGAVALALDIQEALQGADWGVGEGGVPNATIIREAYHDIAIEKGLSLSAATVDAAGDADRKAQTSVVQGLKVRIGIDYGDGDVRLDPVSKGYDYVGETVNGASRIEAAGHGMQTLASDCVIHALERSVTFKSSALADGMVLQHLGSYWFKGADAPCAIYQVQPKLLQYRRFPPPRGVRLESTSGDSPSDIKYHSQGSISVPEGSMSSKMEDGAESLEENEELQKTQKAQDAMRQQKATKQAVAFVETIVSTLNKDDRSIVLKKFCGAWRVAAALNRLGQSDDKSNIDALSARVAAVAWKKVMKEEREHVDRAASISIPNGSINHRRDSVKTGSVVGKNNSSSDPRLLVSGSDAGMVAGMTPPALRLRTFSNV